MNPLLPPDPPNILSAEWWENFRCDVFQLVAWGYQIEESEIRKHHLEEDITGLIRRGIDKKLDTDVPPRFDIYTAHNEDPVDDGSAFGKDRPIVDISVQCSGPRPRQRYRIEAKRCAKRTNAIGWYSDGITDYVTLKYAKGSPEAGMLGLMQSDDVTYWKQQLRKKLAEDESLGCKLLPIDIEITPDIEGTTSSTHQRSDGSAIVLVHAFIDCA